MTMHGFDINNYVDPDKARDTLLEKLACAVAALAETKGLDAAVDLRAALLDFKKATTPLKVENPKPCLE
jgi:hypothetical protein